MVLCLFTGGPTAKLVYEYNKRQSELFSIIGTGSQKYSGNWATIPLSLLLSTGIAKKHGINAPSGATSKYD